MERFFMERFLWSAGIPARNGRAASKSNTDKHRKNGSTPI
jgi:hypothetical protein